MKRQKESSSSSLQDKIPLSRKWDILDISYPNACIHDLIYQQAEQTPAQPAVSFEGQTIDYKQLEQASLLLSQELKQKGIKKGSFVGIAMERSIEMVVALVAILESGAAYIPIDPEYPTDRVSFMFGDASLDLVLTQTQLLAKLPIGKIQHITYDRLLEPTDKVIRELSTSSPEDLAYAMYTSGSTGNPKSAQITHAGIVNLLEFMKEKPGLTQHDTLVEVISLSHDMSVSDIFLALSTGAHLVVIRQETLTDGKQLATLLNEVNASFLSATPTTFRMLLEANWMPRRPIKLLSAGEPLPLDIIEPLLVRGCDIWNGYGMTEASVYSTLTQITDSKSQITIGGRISNTPLYILNENEESVDVGEIGELYIGGVGVGPGYRKRPELTKERFVSSPFPDDKSTLYRTGDLASFLPNGDVVYKGRIDQQIKIRGFRIEIEEIELKLKELPAVSDAIVSTYQTQRKEQRLVAYVVSNSPKEEQELFAELHQKLSSSLPAYMLPHSFLRLKAIPQTPMGKVDRKALPKPSNERPVWLGSYVPPTQPLQRELCSLYQEVLALDRVGVDDDFFALGGHSLLATRLLFRLEKLGYIVQVREIFKAPTPKQLALQIQKTTESAKSLQKLPIQQLGREKPLPLSFPQKRLWFFHLADPSKVDYHVSTVLTFHGKIDKQALQSTINQMVQRHEVFRTVFSTEEDQAVQVIQEPRPLFFSIASLEHLPSESREEVFQQQSKHFFRRPFALSHEWPIRLELIQLSEKEHRLLFCMHHIISDGWSLQVLLRDFQEIYSAHKQERQAKLPKLPIQYADFSHWQQNDTTQQEQLSAYWSERLQDIPAPIALPYAKQPNQQDDVDAIDIQLQIKGNQYQTLQQICREHQVTPYMVLLTALSAYISHSTGQKDLPIGTMFANRTRPELEDLIGFFANTLVMRVQLEPNDSFLSLLKKVKAWSLEAYEHQDMPFQRLVRLVKAQRNPQQPLFQACFILQDPPTQSLELPEATCSIEEVDNGTSPFDLLLQLWQVEDSYTGSFLCRKSRFTTKTSDLLAKGFQGFLKQILQTPQVILQTLETPIQRQLDKRLRKHAQVQDAVSYAKTGIDGTSKWILFYTSQQKIPAQQLQDFVSSEEKLQDLPLEFVRLSQLPSLLDGTIDHAQILQTPIFNEESKKNWLTQVQAEFEIEKIQLQAKEVKSLPLHIEQVLPNWRKKQNQQSPKSTKQEQTAIQKDDTSSEIKAQAIRIGSELIFPEDTPENLPDILRRTAKKYPQKGIVNLDHDGNERSISYPDLVAQAEKIAASLQQKKISKGSYVLLQLEDNQDFIPAIWACFFGGYVAVPLATPGTYNQSSGAREKLFNIWQAHDKPIIIGSNYTSTGLLAYGKSEELASWNILSIDELRENTQDYVEPKFTPDDLILLLLTSGSTGVPKSVSHHHRTIRAFVETYGQRHHFDSNEVFLNWLGLDHVAPLFMCHLSAVYQGAQNVNAPLQSFLQNPLKCLDWVDKYKATTTFAPNFAFGLVNEKAEEIAKGNWDLSSFRVMANGGESIVARTARRFMELLEPFKLPKHAMVPIWGMSETSSATITYLEFSRKNSNDSDSFVSIGDPVPGFAMRIVDDKDLLLLEGDVGRLQVKGEPMMSGYHRRPEANAESYTADGWFDTGDLGFIDEKGLTLTGRSKDVIIIHGNNYYSHEIEAAVQSVEGVLRSFVVACAVRTTGAETDQLAIFFSEVKKQEPAELRQLLRKIRGLVTKQIGIRPSFILPVEPEQIPKTEIGKLQRSKIKNAFMSGAFEQAIQEVDCIEENQNTIPDWFFQRSWSKRKISLAPKALPKQNLLIFTHSDGPSLQLAKSFEKSGHFCHFVFPKTDDRQNQSNLNPIDHFDPNAYTQLFEQLEQKDQLPDKIIHLWTYYEETSQTSLSQLQKAQELGCYSILEVYKQLSSYPKEQKVPALLVISQKQQQSDKNQRSSYLHAPLIGLLTTIPHENPDLQVRHIDFEDLHSQNKFEWLQQELQYMDRFEPEVRYQNGARQLSGLQRYHPKQSAIETSFIQEGSLVAITGGMGGVGRRLAKELVEQFNCKLLLLGRTPKEQFSTEKKQQFDTLQQLCSSPAQLRYEGFDLQAKEELEEAVKRFEKQHTQSLAGIFHLAGSLSDTLLHDESKEGLQNNYSSGVWGRWSIEQLFETRPKMFCVDFGSINEIFGGFSAGAYAASSRFGESWSRYLRETKGYDVRHLIWCRWDQIGMTKDLPVGKQTRAKGYLPISETKGLVSLFTCLNQPAQTMIIGLDQHNQQIRRHLSQKELQLEHFELQIEIGEQEETEENIEYTDLFGAKDLLPVRYVEKLTQYDSALKGSSTTGTQKPATEQEQKLAEIWKNVLSLEEVGVQDNFFDLGGHSMLLIQLQSKIETAFSKKSPIVQLFQYPTIQSFAANFFQGQENPNVSKKLEEAQERAQKQKQRRQKRRRQKK